MQQRIRVRLSVRGFTASKIDMLDGHASRSKAPSPDRHLSIRSVWILLTFSQHVGDDGTREMTIRLTGRQAGSRKEIEMLVCYVLMHQPTQDLREYLMHQKENREPLTKYNDVESPKMSK